MPFIFIIIILIIVVSFLCIKQHIIKSQLKEISYQIQNPNIDLISIDLVDKDLENLTLHLNKKFDLLKSEKVNVLKNEKDMKTAISMISHDMRTPLTSVIGYLQLAEKNCKDEETLQNIRIALDRAKYSNKLVDDFFELSVIDSNQYTPIIEKLNLCALVCEEILANFLAFENKGITPLFNQADDTITILADLKLITRVLQNLMANAIKYSTGKLELLITEDEYVTLSISNSISTNIDAEKIFDKFYRADISRNGDGAGLGLYICKKLVEEMNGHIYANCENNSLSIYLEFPKAN